MTSAAEVETWRRCTFPEMFDTDEEGPLPAGKAGAGKSRVLYFFWSLFWKAYTKVYWRIVLSDLPAPRWARQAGTNLKRGFSQKGMTHGRE